MAQFADNPELKRSHMLTTPIPRLVLTMALPTIASMLVQSFYNLADTYFVSSLGTNATSAVGINASLEGIITMAGSFLGVGAASYISRLLGSKEDAKADSVMATAFFTSLFFGVIVMVLGRIFIADLVRLLGAPPEVVPYSMDYAEYVLYAAPIMTASLVLNQCLRAEGSAIFSMVGIVAGAVINVALDPLFIFTFGWGVKGASAATAISKLISFLILLTPYIRRKTLIHIKFKAIKYTWDTISQVSKIGSASLFRMAFTTVSAVALNTLAGKVSSSALAAVSVSNRVMTFLVFACLGFAQGFTPVAGYSWGAKRYDRVREGYRFASWTAILGITVPSIVLFIFAKPIVSAFTADDAELIKLGVFCLRTQCAVMPIHAWVIVLNMLCSGTGRALSATILSISRQGLCFLPLLPIFVHFFGVYGITSVQAAAELGSVVLAIPIAIRFMKLLSAKEKEAAHNEAAPLPTPADG